MSEVFGKFIKTVLPVKNVIKTTMMANVNILCNFIIFIDLVKRGEYYANSKSHRQACGSLKCNGRR